MSVANLIAICSIAVVVVLAIIGGAVTIGKLMQAVESLDAEVEDLATATKEADALIRKGIQDINRTAIQTRDEVIKLQAWKEFQDAEP